MRRVILQEPSHIQPFNEPARDLRVQNKPLWLWQRDLLTPHVSEEREYPDWATAHRIEGDEQVETLVQRDNLFFNKALIEEFIARARAGHKPVRIAFKKDDPAVVEHVRPLTRSFFQQGDLLLADMWYLPKGVSQSVIASPLVIETEPREVGYYHVPPYMASVTGDLVYQLPRKAIVSLESWVHLFVVDILFGVFARGQDMQDRIDADWLYRLKILAKALYEQKQVLDCSELVQVGRNVNIDPSAVIHGPTTIGNNVTIGPGAVIDNCIIGNNVNVAQGCELMLSVVSDGCFLPFRASLFMTTLMENSMVAQNTCLQLCVVGRDSFVGAGTTFTDFNVLPAPLRAHGPAGLEVTNMFVLGGCVGHHCRVSSGLIIYPARTIESDVVLLANEKRQYITQNVVYEDSDHHALNLKYPHPRLYPRQEDST
jgi:UDP-N-acetylglucosamine diphosphorylase / glucose-1-phosphate thymidylyltransferase / UDP-N-acetylgalactosamine diphosphorylase / glucosamine-1-phosphate N-acetyltransferase / galactosamine-1-phosphate N-acetyltransferase